MPRFHAILARRFIALLLLLALLSAALAALGRAGQDLSVDEPFTALALTHHPGGFGAIFAHDNIPLYYGLLSAWTTAFGHGALGLRSLSLFVYGIAVFATGLAGRKLGGPVTGLVAAALVATSARIGLLHAATARPYALLCAIAALALLVHLRAMDDGRSRGRQGRDLIAIVLVHLAGLFTQPGYVFVAIACMAASFVTARRTADILHGLLPGLSCAIYLAVWMSVLDATFALPATAWMSKPAMHDLVQGALMLWGSTAGHIMAGALLGVVIVRRTTWPLARDRRWLFAAVVAVVALGGAFGASFIKPVYLAARTPILILPAAAVAIAALLVRSDLPGLELAVVACCAFPAAQFAINGLRGPDPAPTSAAVREVRDAFHCGDHIVAAGLSFAPVVYYADRAAFPACARIASFPGEIASHPGWLDAASATSAHDALVAEGRQLASSLGSDARLFVFAADRGIGVEATRALDEVSSLVLERRIPIRGTFFDHVRVYRRCCSSGDSGRGGSAER